MSLAFEIQKAIDRFAGIPLTAIGSALRAATRTNASRRDGPPTRPRRILLVKFWGLGNLSMFLPIARAWKDLDPTVEIDLLTLEANREFAAPCPHIDRLLLLDPTGFPLASIARLAVSLRARRYDLAIDGEQFLRLSALLAALAAPRYSVGFRTRGQHRHGLHDRSVECTVDRHMLHLFRDLARAAGVRLDDRAERYVPRSIAAARRVKEAIASWRDTKRPLVVMHPGSGDNFIGRRWPAESYARTADLLIARHGAQVVFTGVESEAPLAAIARRRMSGPSVDLMGKLSLLESIELLALADLVITNDTAPAHFAAALDRPQIAIFGPNSPRLYGPLSPHAATAHAGLGCSPCLLNTNAKSSYCRRPQCMTAIDPLHVYALAEERLIASSIRRPEDEAIDAAAMRAAGRTRGTPS